MTKLGDISILNKTIKSKQKAKNQVIEEENGQVKKYFGTSFCMVTTRWNTEYILSKQK